MPHTKNNEQLALAVINTEESAIELASTRWVTMSNALIRAGQGLSLPEKRIISAAISKLDSAKKLLPGQVPITKISAAEYAELAECQMPTAYQALQDATKSLMNRKITFFTPAHRRNGKAVEIRTDMRWVGRCTYHDGEGYVELAWWPELLPHLLGLKKQFTSYQLSQASTLRSTYSWRLLELLMRFRATGWAEYDIDDFAIAMDATEKQKANFNNIKRRIIEPAVRELCEKDGWHIEWEQIKTGRRVTAVRFTFERDPQARVPFDEPDITGKEALVEQ